MKSAYIAVGYRCNHRCLMCPLSTRDRLHAALSYEQIIRSIEDLSAGDHITLSGGEPTLVPFLLDLIQEILKRGIRITLLSNGIGFTVLEMVERLAEIVKKSPFNVVIAIHSANPEIHDAMTGLSGSFDQSMLAIHQVLDAGVNVTLKYIISGYTITGLPDLAKRIAEEFTPNLEIQLTSMDYSGHALKKADEFRVTFEQARHFVNTALDILLHQCHQAYRVSMIEMPLCACSPEYWFCFRQTGNTSLYLAPNVENTEKIIRELPNQCAAIYPPCHKCDVRCFCPGTWYSAYRLIGETLINPIKCVVL